MLPSVIDSDCAGMCVCVCVSVSVYIDFPGISNSWIQLALSARASSGLRMGDGMRLHCGAALCVPRVCTLLCLCVCAGRGEQTSCGFMQQYGEVLHGCLKQHNMSWRCE